MKKVCQEIIDFFEREEGWSKEETLSEYCNEVLEEENCIMVDSSGDPLCGISPDEISLIWGNEPLPMTLDDFARKLFDKILEGVCNVVRTA